MEEPTTISPSEPGSTTPGVDRSSEIAPTNNDANQHLEESKTKSADEEVKESNNNDNNNNNTSNTNEAPPTTSNTEQPPQASGGDNNNTKAKKSNFQKKGKGTLRKLLKGSSKEKKAPDSNGTYCTVARLIILLKPSRFITFGFLSSFS